MKPPDARYPWIIASQYFLYFSVMGMFLPYFNLYCFHIGLDGFQIGILSAARSIAIIIFPISFSLAADRFQLRKPIYIACCFISTTIWTFFIWTVHFKWMLALSVFYGIFYAPIISFLEAMTMDTLGKEKKTYGTVRVWGSISFILTVIIMGKIIDRFAIHIIVAGIWIISFLHAFSSAKIPYHQPFPKKNQAPGLRFFLKPRIVVFLFCAFLMLVSHGAYYGFFSIHLEKLGYSNAYIGAAWALASVAEIIAMMKSKALFKRFALEKVLIFSFAVAVIRWVALYWTTSLVCILMTQVLHAVTYGTFHMAGILYIDKMTPDESKTMGQALNNAATYGLGLMIGFFINGYAFTRVGSAPLFLISAAIAGLGGVTLAISLVFPKTNHRKRVNR
jgi:MFS transporter, PPP family, 3-phenylpropionic acid transporter